MDEVKKTATHPGAPRGKRPRVQVSLQEKERAIYRIRSGETKAGISRELGVPESTVRGWVKRADLRIAKERENAMLQTKPQETNVQLTTGTKSTHVVQPTTKTNVVTAGAAGAVAAAASSATKTNVLPPMQGMLLSRQQHVAAVTQNAINVANYWNSNAPAVSGGNYGWLPMQTASVADEDQQARVLAWLHVFNAGLLNFSLIAAAASHESRLLGESHRTLWDLIHRYIDKYGNMNCTQNGFDVLRNKYFNNPLLEMTTMASAMPIRTATATTTTATAAAAVPSGTTSMTTTVFTTATKKSTAARATKTTTTTATTSTNGTTATRNAARSNRATAQRPPAVPPPFHVTAPDDDDDDDDDEVVPMEIDA